MLYDGVMLSIQDDGVNEVKYYYALLSEEGEEGTGGKLTNYAAGWVTQEFRTDGIEHISGNFGSDRTVILAKYTDGTIVGYDYAAEQLLFTTADMVTYARMSLRSLFRSAFNPGVTSDPNYMGVLAEGNATAAGDTEAIGNNSGPFVNQEAEASGTGGVLEGGSNPIEGTTAVSGDVAAAGSGNDEGGSGVTGSAMSNGSAASDGHAISNSDAAGDGSVDSKDTKTGSSKEPVNFVSGTGTTGSTEVTGTGRGTGTGNGNGGGGTSRNEEQQLAEVGNMVVYDPISGRYLSVEAKDLLTGAGDAEATHQLLSEQEANQNTQEEEQEKTDMDEDTFKIGTGVGRVLDEENRGGFVMLGILAAAVGCLLIILYVKSVRKKQ